MTRDEVLKLCEIVGSHPEEFLLEIGCRKRTSNKPLPYIDDKRILIPYGNRPSEIVSAVLQQPSTFKELARFASPGVLKERDDESRLDALLRILLLDSTEIKQDSVGHYSWKGTGPRKRLKVLEIPRDSAEKLLVLGM